MPEREARHRFAMRRGLIVGAVVFLVLLVLDMTGVEHTTWPLAAAFGLLGFIAVGINPVMRGIGERWAKRQEER